MKKKQFYLILNKKNKHTYGAFPRTKEGKESAVKYKKKLISKNKSLDFIIK
jgi:hypothetical protein